eukprot:g19575.t1
MFDSAWRYVVYVPPACAVLLLARLSYKIVKRKWLPKNAYKGQTVVITGASSGIGAACAEQYAALGAHLVLAARRAPRLEETKRRCLAKGQPGIRVEVMQCDVTNAQDCRALVERTKELFGRLDLLLLNAGVGGDKKYLRDCSDLDNHRNVMEVNYFGVLAPIKYALALLRETAERTGHKACVAVISSVAGITGTPNRTAYSPSKFAVIGLGQALQLEERKHLDVCLICPGYVLSEIHDKELEARGQVRNMAKFMSAEECARRVAAATHNRDRMTLMETPAWGVYYLGRFVPNWIMDPVIIKSSDSAFVTRGSSKQS